MFDWLVLTGIITLILLGLVGVLLPILPGTLLIWAGVGLYVWAYGFTAVSLLSFAIITLIAVVTGTADVWLPLFGAKTQGASWRSLGFGVVGAIAGTFVIPIPIFGSVIGYAIGTLLGEYSKEQDWHKALRISAGGLAGWGISTLIKLGGGLLILGIFLWQVATG